MDEISVADIESWLDSFDKPGAARKAWAVFRSILRLAYRRGVTDNDVTRREIRLPHLRHYEPQVLTAPEVRRLLKGFYGHPLEAWLLVSVCAGLRRCESVGSTYSHCTLLQLSPAKEPEYLTGIMPVRMTVRKAIQARM